MENTPTNSSEQSIERQAPDIDDLSPSELCTLAADPNTLMDHAFKAKSTAIAKMMAAMKLGLDNQAQEYIDANLKISEIIWDRRFEFVEQRKDQKS